jgi:hypothetical protein
LFTIICQNGGVLGINVNYWWNMGDTSTKSRYFINDWYFGQIFSLFIPVIMVLYIYKYWNKTCRDWFLCFIIFNMFLDLWNSTVLFFIYVYKGWTNQKNFSIEPISANLIYIVERIRISYFLAFSRVARFYATTEQNLIHSFWNALRIRRKINQLHQSSFYTSSIYYTTQYNPWIWWYRW